jgi:hypothetical protein
MTNHTESGALAVGAPGSVARLISELEHYLKSSEADAFLDFSSTFEGMFVCKCFALAQGCGDNPDENAAIHYCILYRHNLHYFLVGFLSGLKASVNAPRG